MDVTQTRIPGPAQVALAEVLELAKDCTVGEMIDEITRLQMAAAEGPLRQAQGTRKRKGGKSEKGVAE